MFCSKCGTKLPDEAAFCPSCGNAINGEKPTAPQGSVLGTVASKFANLTSATPQGSVENLSLFGYYVKCLKNYVNFKGRARRKEFWGFILFDVIISLALCFFENLVIRESYEDASIVLLSVYFYAMLLPRMSVLARRLHDIGEGYWYYWFAPIMIPIFFEIIDLIRNRESLATSVVTAAGGIIYLWRGFKDGQPGENIYGPSPKGIEGFYVPPNKKEEKGEKWL